MNYNKSKAENRAINNTRGPQDMGDNGPRKIYGSISVSGRNGDGLNGGRLYGKTGSAKASSGLGGNMSGAGFPAPPRQSMASGTPVKPTTLKLGGGTVKAKIMERGGAKSMGGGDGDQ